MRQQAGRAMDEVLIRIIRNGQTQRNTGGKQQKKKRKHNRRIRVTQPMTRQRRN